MEIEAVYEMVSKDLEAVEKELARNIQSEVSLIPTLGKHILNSGGKRFRPLILILSARFCGYLGNDHISLAGILEFIHTATLLHDDVVDDAKVRRGNQSAHTIWGNQASILIGDFFFAQSFSLISQTRNWRLLKVLTEATSKLAKGEILDLVKEGDTSCSEEDYFSIVTHKTASLIEAASHMGAILGVINLFWGIGSAVGPLVTGYLFDVTGSYLAGILIATVLTFTASATALFLRPPPGPE